MAHAVRPHRRRTSTPISRRTSTRACCASSPAARRRRQVDPDRPAALRLQDDLRGPAGGARGRLQEGRHPGRRDRLRAAGRRPGRRARAGHHHRRRLPLLLHRQAQVHRRRHARPRAVHPQHGHRRLDRRPRRDPDRCAQGRADPDPAAQLPASPARHPPRRAGGQQDGPGRTTTQDVVRRDRRRLPRLRRRRSASTTFTPIPMSALRRRQHHRAQRATRPGTTARRCMRLPGDGRRSTTTCADKPFRMPVQWVNRPNLDFRGFSGHDRLAASSGRATGSRSCPRAARATVARIVTIDGDLTEAVAGQSVTLTLADEIDVSRGDVLAAAGEPAGGRRPVRGHHGLDATKSRCCRAGPTC